MIEGQGSKDFITIKVCFIATLKSASITRKNAKAVVQHLKCQVEAGAIGNIMIFDTWGGLLSRAAYQEFSLRYITFILDSLKPVRCAFSSFNCLYKRRVVNGLKKIAGCGANALDSTG